jgi:hypothetical protein
MAMGVLAVAGLTALTGCGGGKGGVMGHAAPDEFAVQRRAPLVIPPDFALTPPRPGAPRPQEADSSTLALQAMFGGQAQRSASEAALTGRAGSAPDTGIRSTAGDPNTTVVDKGGSTRDILSAPESTSPEASASVPK